MEPPFTAFTQLEQRLEKTRKQKSKLGHEFGKKTRSNFNLAIVEYFKIHFYLKGAGRTCLACGDKCVGGLNLHFWRKICINCKCKKETHDLLPEDYEVDDLFEVLGKVKINTKVVKSD